MSLPGWLVIVVKMNITECNLKFVFGKFIIYIKADYFCFEGFRFGFLLLKYLLKANNSSNKT